LLSFARVKRRYASQLGVIASCLVSVALGGGCGSAHPEPVSVFPLPASRSALPQTQITFRGVRPAQLHDVVVRGSSSGLHTGVIRGDSDGQGASFVPSRAFAPGETVTVKTSLTVRAARHGVYTFTVATPEAPIAPAPLPAVPAAPGTVQKFHSRPDLQPAALAVDNVSAPDEGDIFVASQDGPVQDGPMIVDARGSLIWFRPYPVSDKVLVTDFRVQDLYGQPVLTWWQGNMSQGSGRGEGVIFDQHYREVATVKAANGLKADLHEFLITPRGHAFLTAFSPVSIKGIAKPVVDAVVQEIDIKTGLVLFEWHALDHIPFSYSDVTPSSPGHVFDPYHVNSVWPDRDGNVIVSMRNTSAVYKIDHRTGRIIWTLGGKHSSFKLGPGAATAFQHDAVLQPDGTLTAFDDGAGPPKVHQTSRGVRLRLNTHTMTASLLRQYEHQPATSANFEGGLQELPGGEVFLGWGQQPYFSEATASGRQDLDARFLASTPSYRAYRFPWAGVPQTLPAVSATRAGRRTAVYASWNGATGVAGWRVFGGPSAASLSPLSTAAARGFETRLIIPAQRYVRVQALDRSGRVLASSATVSVR
jgi:outer membrane protein assembly factor BamB